MSNDSMRLDGWRRKAARLVLIGWIWFLVPAADARVQIDISAEADPPNAVAHLGDAPTDSGAAESSTAAAPASPLEVLRLMGIDQSQLDFLNDDRPIVDSERETLVRLLFRIVDFRQADLDQWSQPVLEWQRLASETEQLRFRAFELSGNITDIQVEPMLPELVRRYRFRNYFRVRIANAETDQTAIVLVRELPQAWLDAIETGNDMPLPQSVRVQGLLLKRVKTDGADGRGVPLLVAPRIAWFPTKPTPILGVQADQVRLAQQGVDISRLTDFQHRREMTSEDREAFYQMLSAVRGESFSSLKKAASTSFDFARMIRHPSQVTGGLFTVRGRARRVIRIEVQDPDIRQRFGIDHYYEVEVFVELPQPARFFSESDPQGKPFTDYPFVFCVAELPDEIPRGDLVHVAVDAVGFFAKLWSYRTDYMDSPANARAQASDDASRPKDPMQVSPLLIGPTLRMTESPKRASGWLSIWIALGFFAGLLLIWLYLWRSSAADRKFTRTRLRPDTSVDWGNLNELDDSGP